MTLKIISPFHFSFLKPQSHYTQYDPRLEDLLGGGSTSKDASLLPGFGVSHYRCDNPWFLALGKIPLSLFWNVTLIPPVCVEYFNSGHGKQGIPQYATVVIQ